jgi:hypothetical protein
MYIPPSICGIPVRWFYARACSNLRVNWRGWNLLSPGAAFILVLLLGAKIWDILSKPPGPHKFGNFSSAQLLFLTDFNILYLFHAFSVNLL